MARVQFSPVPPTKQFRRRRLVARIADLQSADGSSILLAGAMCPVRPMDQDRTLRTFRFGFESRAGYQVVKWWPSGKGTSLSMRTRWVRLPSTSPTCRGVAKLGLKHSALTREIESSNLSSPASLISCYISFVNRALSLSCLLRHYWSSRLSSYCSL